MRMRRSTLMPHAGAVSAHLLVRLLLLLLTCQAASASVWPKLRQQDMLDRIVCLRQGATSWLSTGHSSPLLNRALNRYQDLVYDTPSHLPRGCGVSGAVTEAGYVQTVSVHVTSSSEELSLNMDESYTLTVDAPETMLTAESVFGALRGLETLSQLLERVEPPPEPPPDPSPSASNQASWRSSTEVQRTGTARSLLANSDPDRPGREPANARSASPAARPAFCATATVVRDAPRFRHRGLLIDTGRHFLPVRTIKAHLDAMAWAKLNVLHWHVVDDQSFPYVSAALPRLSDGAFSPDHVYTAGDVADVIMYARDRGIRVVPEFDTPGHTLSWGRGYPDLLVDCYDAHGRVTGMKGPLDPTSNGTYTALAVLLAELVGVFPDQYLHLGGDEVPFDCWQSNPEVRAWMAARNLGQAADLEQHYLTRLLQLTAEAGRSYVVWQEILDNNVTVAPDTVVHIWKWWWPVDNDTFTGDRDSSKQRAALPPSCRLSSGCFLQAAGADPQQPWAGCTTGARGDGNDTRPGWVHEMQRVTRKGLRALLSAPWYLNLGEFAKENWLPYYLVEPLDFNGTAAERDLVMGGEAAMWGEFTDATNSVAKTWPDAAAVAERLWSPSHVRDVDDARQRLTEFRCRMLGRGSLAGPLGPGFCPADVNV